MLWPSTPALPTGYHARDRPESEPRKRPNPTPEQLAAREELAEARRKTLERKKRTRRLIQVGGVMAAWGIDSPEQAEELMRALTSAERRGWRRYLLGTLGARRTDRWPER
jgi:hypothetical protein